MEKTFTNDIWAKPHLTKIDVENKSSAEDLFYGVILKDTFSKIVGFITKDPSGSYYVLERDDVTSGKYRIKKDSFNQLLGYLRTLVIDGKAEIYAFSNAKALMEWLAEK